MADEVIETKQDYYNLSTYKDEISRYVTRKYRDLDVISVMRNNYKRLYTSVFAGTEESTVERFPHAAEMFKVYKSAIIQACLSGYSSLVEISGNDAYSTMVVPQLKNVMIDQFKSISLLENLTSEQVDDWLLKGESVAFIKLKEDKEEYRIKTKMIDDETGEEVLSFKMKEVVSSKNLMIDYINPLDFFVDAYDYKQDPRGCAKIIRSFIDSKTLLASNDYPLLSKEDKQDIIASVGRNGKGIRPYTGIAGTQETQTTVTDRNRIEVLTYYGDYITEDYKLLSNIIVTVINNRCANIKYNPISTNRIIYAPYKIDEQTHRSISPLMVSKPVDTLINRVVDLFLTNLEDTATPWILYPTGSLNKTDVDEARANKQLEYNNIDTKPEFFAPPPTSLAGLNLVTMILEQNKNVLGLNNYLTGDTSGAVRTARESAILSQNANARMRVETDVFSYRFLLNLFTSFYAFNREIAFATGEPLDPIYADEKLNVSISTNASRADKEGELRRLMDMLNLPIAQMIFSNLTPDQIILAVRYLMAKAELTDIDNILELMQAPAEAGETPPTPQMVGGQGQISDSGMIPTEIPIEDAINSTDNVSNTNEQ